MDAGWLRWPITVLLALGLACGREPPRFQSQPGEVTLVHLFSVGDDEDWPGDRRNAEGGRDQVVLGRVADAALTPEGGLVVLDALGANILRFAADGGYLGTVGRKGQGPGEMLTPSGIAVVSSGAIVVWDPGLARMSVFDRIGRFERSWRVPEPSLVADRVLFPSGDDGVLLRVGGRSPASPIRPLGFFFLRFDTRGAVGDSIAFPGEPVAVPLVPGPIRDAVPFVAYPDWTVLRSGTIALTPRSVYHVTLFGPRGQRTEIVRDVPAPAVLRDEAEAWRSAITKVVRRRVPGWDWDGWEIPPRKPVIRRIEPADDGRLLVLIHSPAEPVNDTTESGTRWVEPSVIHIHSAGGALEAVLRLPPGSRLLRLRGDRLAVLSRSVTGAPKVDVYRIVPNQRGTSLQNR
ncbi:MAG: hypothetical protein AMXMBFR53_23520 [Gemmatimonadota bacterium]